MKKLGLVVAVLMVVATPAWAAKSRVDIKCSAVGKVITVSYKVNPTTEEPNKVSGFGLDITVDNGAKITDVSNYPIVATNGKYWVYPGSIDIVNGEVNDVGSPVADPNSPGALGGIGKSGITIEMGALYYPTGDNSPNSPNYPDLPPWTGNLLSFTVDKDCCVTITENATRGGVVLTNPALNPDVNAPKFCITELECLPNSVAYYQTWKAQNSPDCWCYPRQCYGDADCKKEGSVKTGYFWVHFNDLNVLLAAWNQNGSTQTYILAKPHICADFAHDVEGSAKTGYFRVHFSDLNNLLANWSVTDPNPPANCGGSLVPP